MRLPALFIGHGSPMNAIEPTRYSQAWQRLGVRIRQQYGAHIRAILAISAHWLTPVPAITAMLKPRTIHDFGNFPRALFEVQYPVNGSPEIAAEIQMLSDGLIQADQNWGLDHGTWSILCHLFPHADVPVLQLSLSINYSSAEHFAFAQSLTSLRERGILVMASGNIVHNLHQFDWQAQTTSAGHDWAEQARAEVNQWIQAHNTLALQNEEAYSPALRLAAPTYEHFWPLLYPLAMQQADERAHLFNDEIVFKALSMTSVLVGDGSLLEAV